MADALVLAAGSVLVGLIALVGTLALARIQQRAVKNEERLRAAEAYDHTYNNLRKDYDRVVEERDAESRALDSMTAERDDWKRRALRAEGQDDDNRRRNKGNP